MVGTTCKNSQLHEKTKKGHKMIRLKNKRKVHDKRISKKTSFFLLFINFFAGVGLGLLNLCKDTFFESFWEVLDG